MFRHGAGMFLPAPPAFSDLLLAGDSGLCVFVRDRGGGGRPAESTLSAQLPLSAPQRRAASDGQNPHGGFGIQPVILNKGKEESFR